MKSGTRGLVDAKDVQDCQCGSEIAWFVDDLQIVISRATRRP